MSSKPHDSSPVANLQTKEHRAEAVLYVNSEEFNELRRELYENWRMDPKADTTGGNSYWYYSGLMVTHPQAFVEIMSMELGLRITFDSGKESEICLEILNALRKKRGVSPFPKVISAGS